MSNSPVHRIKTGPLSISIWENPSQNGPFLSISGIERTFKQGDEWKTTSSLRVKDLEIATTMLAEANKWCADYENDESPPSPDEDSSDED